MERKLIAEINIKIFNDDYESTEITCGEGFKFKEVMKAIKKAKDALSWQLKNKQECPFYEK